MSRFIAPSISTSLLRQNQWAGRLFCAWLLSLSLAFIQNATGAIPVDDSYSVRTWQADDGLPENRVVGVVQAPDGFLWVATQNGLVRFDGVRFQRVDRPGTPSLIAGTMRVLMLDRDGRIWLAKEEGGTLFCFEGTEMRMFSAEQGLLKNEAQRSLAADNTGALWIAHSAGKLVRLNADGQAEIFTQAEGLPRGNSIVWLATDRSGTLWFAKGNRVGVFQDGNFVPLHTFGSSSLRLAPSRDGGMWVCSGLQIFKCHATNAPMEWGRLPAEGRERSGIEPSVVFEDRSGIVWLGTAAAGLYRCESNQVARVELPNPGILSLTDDREGNLWVGSRGGLHRVRQKLTTLIGPDAGLPFVAVQSVCQDATGALWAVGDNGVIARQQDGGWKILPVAASGPEAYVTCAAADSEGNVWVGTRGGRLFRWRDGHFTNLNLREALQEKSLRALLVSRQGDLWISTDASDAIYRLRDGKLHSFSLPPGRRFVRAMAEDAAGNFWAGASDGLLVRVTGDELVEETSRTTGLSIRGLYATPNGDLWLGFAGGGVGRLRDGQLQRFTTEQGLPNDYVSQILRDDRDSLWFAGNQGIFQVRERDFDDVSRGIVTRLTPMIYGRGEGMPGLQASFDYAPAAVQTRDQRLIFTMLSGLAEVRLERIRLNYRPPEVFVERVLAGDRVVAAYQLIPGTNSAAPMELRHRPAKRELRFPPGRQQVQFEFTALSFVAPENVQFRYQLEGLDENWIDAGNRRTVSYAHPPPGRYTFKVTACNNDGIWNKIGDSLPVVFEPFVWETLWFKLTATAVSFGLVCGLVVMGLRRRHRLQLERLERQRAVEMERTRIARDLHDDLGVGLTEIGLLGDLANTGNSPEKNREHVSEISDRARSLAASLDEIVWAINPANDNPQSLVDYLFPYAQRLLSRAGIRCRLELTGALPRGALNSERRHEFFHAFKEALNNVIRHSAATEVQIHFAAIGGDLQICVSDNGCGLSGHEEKAGHHGLIGMRERLQRLGGSCEISSATGTGTTVTFILPMQTS